MSMIKKLGVKKLYKDSCPNCGHRNTQIIQGVYPEYDKWDDTITKFFICEKCLTEYYEKYKLEYNGCEVIELVDTPERLGYEKVCYDADGNKISEEAL
jgi:hypothetical protein